MLTEAFSLWGTAVTWLEVAAFFLSLAGVAATVAEIHWGWPLSIGASVLYGWLFWISRLYGDVAVQVYFVISSLWGWWQWRPWRPARPSRHEARDATARSSPSWPESPPLQPESSTAATGPDLAATGPLRPHALAQRHRIAVGMVWLALWPLVGALLARYTDTDVPYFDALPTAGSFIAQLLLGRKYLENWPLWLVVNLISVALYAYKSLPLTAVLYLVFAALAALGWRQWLHLRAAAPAPGDADAVGWRAVPAERR